MHMEAFIEFAAILMVTIVALFSALALEAVLLRGVFALMEPATATRRPAPSPIAHGARLAARAFARAR
jgi:hypothetical protein